MIKIINFIEAILLLHAFAFCISKFSKKEVNHKIVLFILTLIYSFVYNSFFVSITQEVKAFLSILMTVIICKFFVKLNNKDCVFYTLIIWLTAIIFDILVMNVMNNLKVKELLNIDDTIGKVIGSTLIIIFFYILGNINSVANCVNRIKTFVNKLDFSYYKLVGIIVIYFCLGSYCLSYMNDKAVSAIILVIAFSLLIVILFFMFQQIQINSLKESLKILTKNNEFYIERIDEYRVMKHNLIANLNGVKSTANLKTKKLIDDLIRKYQSMLKMPKNFKNLPSGVNGIIYEKIYNIKDNSLNLKIENRIKNNIIEVLSAKNYNLFCEALGVALDNAIEASEKSKEKLLYLEFTEDEEKIILKIINSFSNIIDLDELGTKNYTSKQHGNGLGLFSILKYKSIKLSNSIKENKFCSIIIVNKTS